MSDVVPKAYYDEDQKAYFISVTTCVNLVSDTPTSSDTTLMIAVTVEELVLSFGQVSFFFVFFFKL